MGAVEELAGVELDRFGAGQTSQIYASFEEKSWRKQLIVNNLLNVRHSLNWLHVWR
jgi:hypothetical protein